MKSIEVNLDTYLWGVACLGSDRLDSYDEEYHFESQDYDVLPGILVLNIGEERLAEDVAFQLFLADEDEFAEFEPSPDMYEITDPQNDLLHFKGARKIGPYVILQDGYQSEDPGFEIGAHSSARFRVFTTSDLQRFEVVLLLIEDKPLVEKWRRVRAGNRIHGTVEIQQNLR